MKKLLFILFIAPGLFSCKKSDTNSLSGNNSIQKYYFNYTVNGKSNGYSFAKAIIDATPSSDWANILGAGGGGFELIGGSYPNLNKGKAAMWGDVTTGIFVQYAGCNADGNPKCYTGSITINDLKVGTYTVSNGLNFLGIAEATTSSQLINLVAFDSRFITPGENMTVIIKSIGNVGEIIAGEFSGVVKDPSGLLFNVNGKFSVPRTL